MRETHAQRAYDHLRSKMIAGDFQPGSRIRYGPVGKELGISATPVREAIGQLANEGFVQLVPQLGAIVREITQKELIELYEMREALEPYAAAKAAERITQRQLGEVRKQYETMFGIAEQVRKSSTKRASSRTVKPFEQADLAFHMLIIEATGNQTMVRTVGNSHVLAWIFSADRHSYDAQVMATTCNDHLRVLKALEKAQPDAARLAMAMHIRNGLEATLAAVVDEPDRWWEPSK
ncbi:GntR family transcriptional regulator [Planctomycetales bacterium 10988]|nr:GntR family transcriptional regulator [Planctomycetales bacterium 10988]